MSTVDVEEIETPDMLPTGDVDVLAEADPAAEVDLTVVSDDVARSGGRRSRPSPRPTTPIPTPTP